MGILNEDINWGFNVEDFVRGLTWFGYFAWGFCMGNLNGGFNWEFYTGILHMVFEGFFAWRLCNGEFKWGFEGFLYGNFKWGF